MKTKIICVRVPESFPDSTSLGDEIVLVKTSSAGDLRTQLVHADYDEKTNGIVSVLPSGRDPCIVVGHSVKMADIIQEYREKYSELMQEIAELGLRTDNWPK